jgi:hypothetical protein
MNKVKAFLKRLWRFSSFRITTEDYADESRHNGYKLWVAANKTMSSPFNILEEDNLRTKEFASFITTLSSREKNDIIAFLKNELASYEECSDEFVGGSVERAERRAKEMCRRHLKILTVA